MGEHSEDDKVLPEMNKKRIVKTRAQVEALEKLYDEHKYPTEALKEEFAKSVGLTEKQVSGWFCHRRLKDKRLANPEAYANGRQDRSSGILQDRGSGLRQDSCGSTKQGDDRNYDPREVESRRLVGQEYSAADLTYELGSHYTGNHGSADDTSSGSSSSLRNMSFPQDRDRFALANSRYQAQSLPMDIKEVKPRTGPSGYLKVKGQVENAAITAVKRQLGRHYWADGPPLGVEFDPLPPGAFESSIQEPPNVKLLAAICSQSLNKQEVLALNWQHLFSTKYSTKMTESYYAEEAVLPRSPENSMVHKNSNLGSGSQYNPKASSHDSDMERTRFKMAHGPDRSENCFPPKYKQKSPLHNHGDFYAGRSSSMDIHEGSARKTRVYDSQDPDRKAKYGDGGMSLDSFSGHRHSRLHNPRVDSDHADPWLQNYNDMNSNVAPAEHFVSKSSNLASKGVEYDDFTHKGLSKRLAKEAKSSGERLTLNGNFDPVQPKNGLTSAKRVRNELPQEHYSKKTSWSEVPPWTNQASRSAAEMPTSFSEDDETADTSSSVD
ncbi:uncharacterized protein [Coffea arabica]|uniref:Uncharacterized protein isoform X1 n=2 Tax=Coffea arabica TaxID=13443 RepID=A0ABM4WKT1_COFAR